MLTIREPISIKCGRPMFSSQEVFAEKIKGNYELIPADIKREDLLHLVMMPPEVYIESGGSSSILTNENTTNIRETKIDVINNLLNRIALTEEADLTYQDRTFITDVLERLGVTDVSEFMNELTSMKQEVNDVRQLTLLYQNSLSELHQTPESFEQIQNLLQNVEQVYEGGRNITLYEDIMNRLQTADIYQELYNFYTERPAAQERPGGERLMFSEQERIFSQMRLNSLETQAAGVSVPLIYRYENSYVDQAYEEETYSQTTAESRITQAVLMDLANDLYIYMNGAAAGRENNWVNAENVFYEAAENTLQRLSMRVEEPSLYFSEHTQSLSERLERYENETTDIKELLTLRQTESERNLAQILTEESETQPMPQAGPELRYFTEQEEKPQNEPEEEKNTAEKERIPGESVQETARRINSSRELQSVQEREVNTFVQGDTHNTAYVQAEEEINISYPESEGSSETPQQIAPPGTEEELLREVEEINRRNEETYRRIQEISQQQTEERTPAAKRREGSPLSLTREESLRALEHPEEVLMELRMRQSEEEAQAAAAREALLQIIPPETMALMEQLGEMQQRRRADEAAAGTEQDNSMQQLLLDIHEVEEENRTEEERISENRLNTERVSETVLEERREYETPAQAARTRTEREYETVSLIHRTLENNLDEEEIADIVARSQTVQHETEQVIRTEENIQHQQVQQQVNVTQTNLQQSEDINEMIQQTIRQQMGTMSDEIYGQMERRLDRERKRRGY